MKPIYAYCSLRPFTNLSEYISSARSIANLLHTSCVQSHYFQISGWIEKFGNKLFYSDWKLKSPWTHTHILYSWLQLLRDRYGCTMLLSGYLGILKQPIIQNVKTNAKEYNSIFGRMSHGGPGNERQCIHFVEFNKLNIYAEWN